MIDPIEDRITRLAARQLGLVTRAQLREAGLSRNAIWVRVRNHRLRIVHRGVYQVGPVTVMHARELAALLACGQDAALSRITAGAIWRMVAAVEAAAPIDIATPFDRGQRPGIRVRRVRLAPDEIVRVAVSPRGEVRRSPHENMRDLDPDHATLLVTSPARTLLDLASGFSVRDLEAALARAEREDLVRQEDLEVLLRRHRRQAGTPVLRELLQRGATPALTRSHAEDRCIDLLRKAQLPEPALNTRVNGIEVDFLWRRERLIVEVDGFAFHASRRRFEIDRRRDATLAAKGFRVMRVTWRQLVHEPEAVLVRIAQALVR